MATTAIRHSIPDADIDQALHAIRSQRTWRAIGAAAILLGVVLAFVGGAAHMLTEHHGLVGEDQTQQLQAPPPVEAP